MIRKKHRIFFILTIIFLSIVISCKPKFDLRNEKDASVQIVEDLRSKKIAFIGNDHNGAFQALFLKENLSTFYNTGVRYIFLEGDANHYLTEHEDYYFNFYPAWAGFGYRYEEVLFGDEIQKINKLHKEDPITVIFPEEGLIVTENEWKDDTLLNNIRDKYIQQKIIETMDNTDSKAIILYGNAHGLKKSEVWYSSSENLYWIRLGYYLDKHYESDFSTYYFYPYSSDGNKTVLYSDKKEKSLECKCLSEENTELLVETENAEREYDHHCLYKKWIHAVPVYYVPTKENLKYMLSIFPDFKISEEKKLMFGQKNQDSYLHFII